MTLGLADPLAGPLAEGTSGTSLLVPGLYDVSINGRPYQLDWRYAGTENFARESIKLLKPQVDDSGEISQRSLNPEEFARQGQESWHKGAGQSFTDRDDSDPARFRTSKGVNPWERWELSLLPTTTQGVSSAGTNLFLVAAGSRLYYTDGAVLKFVTALTFASPTTVTGTPAGTITSIASNGFHVYTCHTANGMYVTDTSSTAAAQLVSTALTANSVAAYVKGRLMVSNNNSIYNVTSLTVAALPTALFTQANTNFVWTGFAEGIGQIYACGYSGDKSLIYKTAVLTDGTALAAPSVAGELPDGEIVRSIQGYLGFMLLGTDQGVRFAVADVNGNLTIGALIDLNVSVRCFEGQDRFVWFGWSNYDGTSTGLGRLDLSELNGSAPAYASDLMATGQGTVLSVCTFLDKRVFSVSGLGFYAEDTNLVASGTFDGGLVTFGLPDAKVATGADVRFEPLDGTVAVALSTNGGTFTTLGTASEADTTSLRVSAGSTRGETFELRFTLTRSAVTTVGPVVTRSTLEANPAPGRGLFITLPLLLFDTIELANGTKATMDTAAEEAALIALQIAGRAVSLQTGASTELVYLDDHRFVVEAYTKARNGWNGTFLARFKRPRSTT